MHYVYIIKWKKEEWYIGYTNDLERRLREHKKNSLRQLVYYEAYQSEKAARMREKKLKYYGSAWRALKARITA